MIVLLIKDIGARTVLDTPSGLCSYEDHALELDSRGDASFRSAQETPPMEMVQAHGDEEEAEPVHHHDRFVGDRSRGYHYPGDGGLPAVRHTKIRWARNPPSVCRRAADNA